ncbi:MAG: hypothetical protein NG747_11040 [Candidatus Brocadia sp.]|nr:hypothetical protein [Candidatus Brocadia sp.]
MNTNVTATLMSAISHVCQLIRVVRASCITATTMIATAPILTESRKQDTHFDALIFGINGFNIATKKKDGKNIPTVVIMAPFIPLT